MYHRQEPPPTHEFVEIAGITWRDQTYPAFLLTMAAALPITLTLRIDRGATTRGIVSGALRRSFLFFFALMIGHSSGYWIGEYTKTSEHLGLLGFAIMFLLFTRRHPRRAAGAPVLSLGRLLGRARTLLLEPFEGGIKKVPGTLRYYFAMGGNALLLLTAMVSVVDLLGKRC